LPERTTHRDAPNPPRGASWAWSVALLAATLALSLSGLGLAQEPPRPAPAPAAVDPQELSFLRSVLGNPTNSIETRRRAAAKLLRIAAPVGAATVVSLLDASAGEARDALGAVFRDAAAEDPELAAALVGSLAYAAVEDRSRISETVVYTGVGIDAIVVEVAVDPAKSVEFRRAAIETLGRLPSRPSAEALLRITDPSRREPAEVRAAAFRSLESLAGLPLGDDHAAWRVWWEREGGFDSLERTCEERAEALSLRLAQSERDRSAVDERADRTAARLRSALAELLLGMDLAARQERVQRLLADELPTLRAFAVEQVERMLRNGDRIGEDMTVTLATLLDDPVASLRGRAAKILASLAWPAIGEEIAKRLPNEQDVADALIALEILAERPAEGSMPALLDRMEVAATAEAAARAVARLQAAGLAPVGWRERAAAIARRSLAETDPPIPAMARVFALSGEESDADAIEALLDSPDARVRRAVAEGWARRGVFEPLASRSSDPAIYLPLAASLVELEPTVSGLDRMLALSRPAESAGEYESVLLRFVNTLPVASLLEADRLLAEAGAPVSVRLEALKRASAPVNGTSLSREVLEESMERRAVILLSLGRVEEVADLLSNQALLPDQPLFGLLFEARLRAGRFDRAASQQPDPAAWIEVMARIAADPALAAAATVIGEEIARRFGDALDDEQIAAISSHRAPAPPPPPSDESATGGSPSSE
jgi:hypothetical protein